MSQQNTAAYHPDPEPAKAAIGAETHLPPAPPGDPAVLPSADGEERDPIRYRILKHFGVVGKAYRDRETELNWVSWNDGYPKFDLRAWDRIHSHMSKGITLRTEEAIRLRDILNAIDFERYSFTKPSGPDEAGEGGTEAREVPSGGDTETCEAPSGEGANEEAIDKPEETR